MARDRRKALGLSQDQLARKVGVSRQWVLAFEKGKPRTEVGLVLQALRVLGIELFASTTDGAGDSPHVDGGLEG